MVLVVILPMNVSLLAHLGAHRKPHYVALMGHAHQQLPPQTPSRNAKLLPTFIIHVLQIAQFVALAGYVQHHYHVVQHSQH